jgi:sulfatase modifying factor 1
MLDTTEFDKGRRVPNLENMVFIEGGTFMMGSDKFYPEEVHKVTVDGFWMDSCPVTNKAFTDFVSATDYMTVGERPLNPADFPNVQEENLVPGSLVFEKRNEAGDLNNYANWWRWMKGASWKHPQGPDSTINGLDDFILK